MSTLSNIEIQIVNHTVCEIEMIKKGEMQCADKMLKDRIALENRYWALKCLMDTGDSQYDDLISYLYEQTKEMLTKLILKY
jgi:hypothetical protein